MQLKENRTRKIWKSLFGGWIAPRIVTGGCSNRVHRLGRWCLYMSVSCLVYKHIARQCCCWSVRLCLSSELTVKDLKKLLHKNVYSFEIFQGIFSWELTTIQNVNLIFLFLIAFSVGDFCKLKFALKFNGSKESCFCKIDLQD